MHGVTIHRGVNIFVIHVNYNGDFAGNVYLSWKRQPADVLQERMVEAHHLLRGDYLTEWQDEIPPDVFARVVAVFIGLWYQSRSLACMEQLEFDREDRDGAGY